MKAHGIDFEEIFIEPKEIFEKQKKDKTSKEVAKATENNIKNVLKSKKKLITIQ